METTVTTSKIKNVDFHGNALPVKRNRVAKNHVAMKAFGLAIIKLLILHEIGVANSKRGNGWKLLILLRNQGCIYILTYIYIYIYMCIYVQATHRYIYPCGKKEPDSHLHKVTYKKQRGCLMKVIAPAVRVYINLSRQDLLKGLETFGRTCYKSEDKITEQSASSFVKRLIAKGHLSVIEHFSITVKFVCDRGVTHELVRHRLASFSQESTRYANYSDEKFGSELTFIKPLFWDEGSHEYRCWYAAVGVAEAAYMDLLEMGARPEQARSVLPNSLKSELVMTCNLREWRHVLDLRSHPAAHPQMREIINPLKELFADYLPEVFGDLVGE